MKLSDLIKSGVLARTNFHAKAMLNKRIRVTQPFGRAIILQKGQVSDMLLDKGDGTYHFEARNTACTVTADEITIL